MNKSTNQSLEQGIISTRQLAFLVVTTIISTADVFLPAFVAQEAQQDSWISVIIGTLSSLLITMMLLTLGLKYPDRTIIQYSCDILGKPLGKLVGFSFVYYFIFIGSAVNRQLGEIFVTAFNPDAPLLVYLIVTVVVGSYAVSKGLEVIARINEMALPIGLGILALIAIVNIPNMDFRNFFPILYNGFIPPIRGGLLIQGWLLETVLVLQLIPFTDNKAKIRKSVALSIILLGLSLQVGTLTIAVFGPLTADFLFPALEYVRIASFGLYLQNLDITIMGVWIIGIFIKVAVFYYCAVLSLSQLFGFKSYKRMIVPVGLLIIALSAAISERIIELYNFTHYIFPFYSSTMGFIIPLLLIIVSLIKEKVTAPKPAAQVNKK